jgi:N-acetylglutamate synthase-like GNAT family acetyltransferase
MNDIPVVIRRLQSAEDVQLAYCCMAEVPTPWPQALCLCREWFARNIGEHVEGYHLQLISGEVIGHLYYAPSERALFPYEVEPGVGILHCEWVQQRHQERGLGKRLFATFIDDMRQSGTKGILVEGTDIEGQMHFQHYLARGFEVVYESGDRKLLFLPITQRQVGIRPLEPRIRPRRRIPVEILILSGYMCPYEVSTQVLLREVAKEFGDQVIVQEVWLTPQTRQEYGVGKGIFINGRQKLGGAETEEAIRRAILEEL